MQSKTFELVLTAKEPISHHDPATGNDSNTLTFNRQKQFVHHTLCFLILMYFLA